MSEAQAAPGMGHNAPPLEELLADQHRSLVGDVDAIAKRAMVLPEEISSDDDLDATTNVGRDLAKLRKRIDATRKEEKEPHLEAGRTVDTFFNAQIGRVASILSTLEARATAWHEKKAAAEKRRREDEARRLAQQEEAARKRAEAAKRPDTVARYADEAEQLAAKREDAEAAIESGVRSVTKRTTESGARSGSRSTWDFQITDYDAIPLDVLRPFLRREDVEKASRSYVRIQKGSASLAGVHVFESTKATFR
ncbi:hypothetical protein [Amorphus sp. 3PC139-8]|uniref:hypothetical protein n=1 Tax=Amorphus sp. 3PC139-8 TaxID=2735676 RepID=UPI00345D0B87